MSHALIIDGIKWFVTGNHFTEVNPLCPKDDLRLSMIFNDESSSLLECPECVQKYRFNREYSEQRQYIINKIASKEFKKIKFINLDDEAIPIAEDKVSSKNGKYFVTARLMESKVGQRLVVYAGEKGKEKKTQIFIEPDIKRLAFDQKDLHPTDVFLKVEAEFDDGTKSNIKK